MEDIILLVEKLIKEKDNLIENNRRLLKDIDNLTSTIILYKKKKSKETLYRNLSCALLAASLCLLRIPVNQVLIYFTAYFVITEPLYRKAIKRIKNNIGNLKVDAMEAHIKVKEDKRERNNTRIMEINSEIKEMEKKVNPSRYNYIFAKGLSKPYPTRNHHLIKEKNN